MNLNLKSPRPTEDSNLLQELLPHAFQLSICNYVLSSDFMHVALCRFFHHQNLNHILGCTHLCLIGANVFCVLLTGAMSAMSVYYSCCVLW
jgi:hypothetical protein